MTFNGLISIAKSSKKLGKVEVKTLQTAEEEQRWAGEVKKFYPRVHISFYEKETELEEEEVEDGEEEAGVVVA